MDEVQAIVKKLQLEPHPEGGYFKEWYRSPQQSRFPEVADENRSVCTSIYFLLEAGQFSALHRIKSDEIWHFYGGEPLEIVEITEDGLWQTTCLGSQIAMGQQLTHVVKAGRWFGSRPQEGSAYSLVGCTVAPGFDFADFEMPDRSFFLNRYPLLKEQILAFTQSSS